jgi:hypothetical protein
MSFPENVGGLGVCFIQITKSYTMITGDDDSRDSAYKLTASRNIKIELANIQRNYIELRTYLMFTYILILYTKYIRRYQN